jgi:hypothetical protein
MILFFLLIAVGTSAEDNAAQENLAIAQLEQRYERESNPRRQAGIVVDLMKHRFEQLKAAYDAVDPEQQSRTGEAYLSELERLGTAVAAARHTGTSKNAEVFLRRHLRDLESLKTNVSYFDRPAIEKLLERAGELREQILYSIMHPPKD